MITKKSNGLINPDEVITRGEFAMISKKILETIWGPRQFSPTFANKRKSTPTL